MELPKSCLRKTTMNRVSIYSKRKKGNNIPYGTCHLCVGNVRIKQSILGAIQEYGNFDNLTWLG